MKILHILGDRQLVTNPDAEGASGVVRVALELAQAQARMGHEVFVAATGRPAFHTVWQKVHLCRLAPLTWAYLKFQARTIDFRQHIPYIILTLKHKFDIIQGHHYSYLRFLRARRRIIHFHGSPFYRGSKNEGIDYKVTDFQIVANSSDAQIAISKFIANEVERGLAQVKKPKKVYLVYNGVDTARFAAPRWQEKALELRQEWGLPPEAVLVLFAGAIVPEKGVFHLARAFAQLAPEIPCLHLALAGTRNLWGGSIKQEDTHYSYIEACKNSLKSMQDAGRVHFLGNVSVANMPAVYAASDIVAIPSVWQEPFGLVALEALASGCPIIATATGGLAELVNEQNGIGVPPADEVALKEAIRTLANNASLRQQLGQAGQAQAQQFSWDIAAQHLETIYENLLAE